jgi:hypothetical protein
MSLTPQELDDALTVAVLAHSKAVAHAIEYFSVHAMAARQDGVLAKATALLEYAEALEESITALSRARNEMVFARCTQKQREKESHADAHQPE